MKKKLSKIQFIRALIQTISFFFLPMLFVDTFNAIKTLTVSIAHNNFNPHEILSQLIIPFTIIITTVLLGRFFCGWLCAFGSLGDLFYFLGTKIFKIKLNVDKKKDSILKQLKYLILLFSFIGIWILGISTFSTWSPWDAFGVINTLPPDFSYAISTFTIGSIFLLLVLIGSLFIERFFCRYLCPLGAFLSIICKIKFIKIKKSKSKCGKCIICTSNCSMGIPLNKVDVVNSGECIQCLKCISPCPRKNVKLTGEPKDAIPVTTLATAATLIGLYYIGNIHSAPTSQTNVASSENNNDSNTVLSTPSENVDKDNSDTSNVINKDVNSSSNYIDGTYEGTGIGFRGRQTSVSITISNGEITDIQTISTGDDAPFYNRAYKTVASEIISTQSTSVDAVSGATFSSNGIMSAVEDALSKAR